MLDRMMSKNDDRRVRFYEDELLGYLGDYAGDYDIDGIVDEVTEVDPQTGDRYWLEEFVMRNDATCGWYLFDACERHLLPSESDEDTHEDDAEDDTVDDDAQAKWLTDDYDFSNDDAVALDFEFACDADEIAAEDDLARRLDDVRMDESIDPANKLVDDLARRLDQLREAFADGLLTWEPREESTADAPSGIIRVSDDMPDELLSEIVATCNMYEPDVIHILAEMHDDEHKGEWTDEDEKALEEFGSLIVEQMDDEQTHEEWVVLSGEMDVWERGRYGAPSWAWIPDIHDDDVPGNDTVYASRDEAKAAFDEIDPMIEWFHARLAEAHRHEDIALCRRWCVELVCRTITISSEGVRSDEDSVVRLIKAFDLDGDEAGQSLVRELIPHL